jgi:hypothetical protein
MTNRNDDEEFLNFLKTEISKKLIIQVYLNDIIGKVIYHIDKTVSIYPNDDKLINEVFKFPEEYLVKVFMPGELISVISGSIIVKIIPLLRYLI